MARIHKYISTMHNFLDGRSLQIIWWHINFSRPGAESFHLGPDRITNFEVVLKFGFFNFSNCNFFLIFPKSWICRSWLSLFVVRIKKSTGSKGFNLKYYLDTIMESIQNGISIPKMSSPLKSSSRLRHFILVKLYIINKPKTRTQFTCLIQIKWIVSKNGKNKRKKWVASLPL